MRVHRRCGYRRDTQEGEWCWSVPGCLECEPADGDQEDEQRIHPHLGRIPDEVGRRGGEQKGRGRCVAPMSTACQPQDRHGRDGEDPRQCSSGRVGVAEDVDPPTEQEVIEAGMPVSTQCLGETDVGGGDVDRQRFIKPQR